ncbi:MAG: flavin reductase family protein [Planctomycetota bacterium]|jgi:flavin reductase (DIM6/NTAB) family NADH-FMN oxidoreductase RutF
MQKQCDYREAIKTKYPEQVVITIAKDEGGRPNPITLGWTMIVSGHPPMMAIAVAKGHYSVETISHSKCFTLVFPSEYMTEAALFFGSHSGRNVDKFAQFPCQISDAVIIDSVLLTDAVANFECTLKSETEAGDHIIFIGEVVASHVNTEPKKRLFTVGPNHQLGSVTSKY